MAGADSEGLRARLHSGLTTGVGKAFVNEAVEALKGCPEVVDDVVLWCVGEAPRSRKAAWLLHGLAEKQPGEILAREEAMLNILDVSADTSVHREVFQALLAVEHSASTANFLFELSTLIPHDKSQPIAMRHLALRLLERHIVRLTQSANLAASPTPPHLSKAQLESLVDALDVLRTDASGNCRRQAIYLRKRLGDIGLYDWTNYSSQLYPKSCKNKMRSAEPTTPLPSTSK